MMSRTVSWVYCGRKEWRGFRGSKLVAWVFHQSGDTFRPQVKLATETRFGPECKDLESAQQWIYNQGSAK